MREEHLHVERFVTLAAWRGSMRRGEPTRKDPDFVFEHAGGARVGIEHTRVFNDSNTCERSQRPGAAAKKSRLRETEHHRNEWLVKLASDYYDDGGVPIDLAISLCGNGLEKGLQEQRGQRLRAEVLNGIRPAASRIAVWERQRAEILDDSGALDATVNIVRLPDELVRYTRAWEVLNNSVGWSRTLTAEQLQRIVDKKAAKLPGYRKAMDDAEVGLLVVADQMAASGRVAYEGQEIDCRGFAFVSLLLFPFECIKVA